MKELGRGKSDQLAPEALLPAVDHPGGVEFADLFDEAQLVRVGREVLELAEPGHIVVPPDSLQAVEEVIDQFDLEVLDVLQAQVQLRRSLVAGPFGCERHYADALPLVRTRPHPDDQD